MLPAACACVFQDLRTLRPWINAAADTAGYSPPLIHLRWCPIWPLDSKAVLEIATPHLFGSPGAENAKPPAIRGARIYRGEFALMRLSQGLLRSATAPA